MRFSPSDSNSSQHSSYRPYESAGEVISAGTSSRLNLANSSADNSAGNSIANVHYSHTQYGRPFAFVNFGDWRMGCFTLVLWEETLNLFRQNRVELERYIGRWVSVTGVISKYRNRPQMVVTMPSEIELLSTESEAKTRLTRPDHLHPTPAYLVSSDRWVSNPPSVTPPLVRPTSSDAVAARTSLDRNRKLNDLYKNYPMASNRPMAGGSAPMSATHPPPKKGRSLFNRIRDFFR